MRYMLVAAGALLLVSSSALAVEDVEKKEQIIEMIRRVVEAHEEGDVTITPAEDRTEAADEDDDRVVVERRPRKGGGKIFKADLDLRKTPVSDALDAISDSSGITIILDPRAIAEVGDVPINLKVNDMALGTALKWICRLAGLDYALRDGAIFVTTRDRLTQNVEMKIYDIRDLTSAVEDFPGPDLSLDDQGVTLNQGGLWGGN